MKLSPGKELLPCAKQVFRLEENGVAAGDVVARFDETLPGRPLLTPVVRAGRRLSASESLERIRARAREEIARLPAALRRLSPPEVPYPVHSSDALLAERDRLLERIRQASSTR